MNLESSFIRLSLAGIFVACAGGCQSRPAEPRSAESAQAAVTESVPTSVEAKIAAAMGELSEADRALALSQKTCLVSGAPLGTMGAPPKVTVNGRDVFICCEGCREELTSHADKYLANLPALPPSAGFPR